MRKFVMAVMVLGMLTFSGCGLFSRANEQYVKDDRNVYTLLAAKLQAYLDSDPTIDPHTKAGYERVLAQWKLRIELAEAE